MQVKGLKLRFITVEADPARAMVPKWIGLCEVTWHTGHLYLHVWNCTSYQTSMKQEAFVISTSFESIDLKIQFQKIKEIRNLHGICYCGTWRSSLVQWLRVWLLESNCQVFELKSKLHYFLAGRPQASYVTTLLLSILTCKMGIVPI